MKYEHIHSCKLKLRTSWYDHLQDIKNIGILYLPVFNSNILDFLNKLEIEKKKK